MQVLLVIFRSGTGDQKVIDVGITALLALQHLINKSLKCLGCVSQAKRHSHKLEKTKGCYDHYLGDISWFERNLVVGTHQVYLREDGGAM